MVLYIYICIYPCLFVINWWEGKRFILCRASTAMGEESKYIEVGEALLFLWFYFFFTMVVWLMSKNGRRERENGREWMRQRERDVSKACNRNELLLFRLRFLWGEKSNSFWTRKKKRIINYLPNSKKKKSKLKLKKKLKKKIVTFKWQKGLFLHLLIFQETAPRIRSKLWYNRNKRKSLRGILGK